MAPSSLFKSRWIVIDVEASSQYFQTQKRVHVINSCHLTMCLVHNEIFLRDMFLGSNWHCFFSGLP